MGSSPRATQRVVGGLFIVATVASVAGSAVQGSILDDNDYLTTLATHDGRLIIAALLYIVAAASAVGTSILLIPFLRPQSESGAVGYVVVRTFENLLYIGGSVAMLAMLTVSKEGLHAVGASDSALAGSALLALRNWSVDVGTLLFAGGGAWILNSLLYRSQLVPRWLSAWGLGGALLLVVYGVAAVLGSSTEMGSSLMLLAMPIAVQEMVFSGWLIVKGLERSDE